ncbi:MAG: hypothetical protein COC06_07440 [Bacteroidales bacterium]|nr:MAG: hypothetical protein COC06_07440 [Bacteroidales bacterium]
MPNDKALRIFLMLFCIFLLSVIFTAFDLPFCDMNLSAYDLGYAAGVTFKNMFKILISVSLCYLVYRKLKAVRE